MTSGRWATQPHYTPRVADYVAGERFGPRLLTSFELVWLMTGSALWTVAGPDGAEPGARTVRLTPGMVALAQPHTTDSYQWDPRVPSSHCYVHFDLTPEPDRATTAGWPLVRPMHEPLAGLTSYLFVLAGLGDPVALARTRDVVDLVVDVFLRGPFPADPAPLQSPHVRAATEHVRVTWEREGMRPVSVPELADAARVSPGHLSREFRAELGAGPATALELVRLGRAAIALRRTNLPLGRIALRHGFGSPYHFSRRFSAAYGTPPGRFRNSLHDTDPLRPLTARLMPLWRALSR